jgi:transposase
MDFPVINPDAAGVDIGAEHIYVAVPPERYEAQVRVFKTFTQDLNEAAAWLVGLGITTVAMESTGVYWIPFFQILEASGVRVFLVNARHVKSVPAAFKTDRRDCRWLRNLHAVGLLNTSFRPEQHVCTIRSIARHRDSLTRAASRQVLHMQKSLTQMNILVHEVLSDITGVSGLAILDAILRGERDPDYLVSLCHRSVKASNENLKKALVGDWREEHLFTLRQSLSTWRHFQQQIADCDAQIAHLLAQFDAVGDSPNGDNGDSDNGDSDNGDSDNGDSDNGDSDNGDSDNGDSPSGDGDESDESGRLPVLAASATTGMAAATSRAGAERQKRDQLTALLGVDLTEVPGVGLGVVEMFFTEVGPDLSRFPSADHFASWLGLAPNNAESGGRVLSRKTRRVTNRLATQLRVAVNSLDRSQTHLGAYLRKMKSRLGAPKAITATAHKLARILFTLVSTRTAYDESLFAQQEARFRKQRLETLKREAASYGYDFVPQPGVS